MSGLVNKDLNIFASPGESACYRIDENLSEVTVTYDEMHAPPNIDRNSYTSRDEMLREEQGQRFAARAHLPVSERYRDVEIGLIAKIKGCARRAFEIIRAGFDVKKGLLNYDRYLISQPKVLAWGNYSAKPAAGFQTAIKPKGALTGLDAKKLQTRTDWDYNGVANCAIEDEGTIDPRTGKLTPKPIHKTVTSSNDRNSPKISMMRTVVDKATNTSIAYTGRPDTEDKAKEQASFIFLNELKKRDYGDGSSQGLKQIGESNTYELTYTVNNLMSPMGITALFGLDEKESIEREQEVLKALDGQVIEVKAGEKTYKVKLKPFYFTQNFNWTLAFGTSSTQSKINGENYEPFLKFAAGRIKEKDRPLFNQAVEQLVRNAHKMEPEEEVFYRDLVCKLARIPIVYHCKSSTDRTAIALGLSGAVKSWRNTGQDVPASQKNPPHSILKTDMFKELFAVHTPANHQVTRVSRSAEGKVQGHRQLPNLIGFEWGKNTFKKNKVVLRLLPDQFKEGKEIFKLKEGPIQDVCLLKPGGMKMHYKGQETYPKHYIGTHS